MTDHLFRVPLDYSRGPEGGTIQLFARVATSPARAAAAANAAAAAAASAAAGAAAAAGTAAKAAAAATAPSASSAASGVPPPPPDDGGPWLLYLQGGPGFEAPRPTEASSWLKAAIHHGFRVVLLDQRGTGRSSPPVAPLALGVGDSASASSSSTADRVYDLLFDRVAAQNAKFYRRYPRDAARARAVVLALAALPGGGAALPSGGVLTPRGFQLLGLSGLGSGGGFDRLHYLLERALCPVTGQVTAGFLKSYESWMSWEANPLYALLHESIYCDGSGSGGGSSGWAAERARQRGTVTLHVSTSARNSGDPAAAAAATSNGKAVPHSPAAASPPPQQQPHAATTTTITLPRPEAFDALAAARAGREVLFTGEMVFPWMFEEVGALRPLARVAERLARKSDWPRLYDLAALRACRVPCAAAVYWEDMYVDFGLSQKTAGRIPTLRQWVTSELMHSGIRDDGARVFEHLMGLVRGSTPLF